MTTQEIIVYLILVCTLFFVARYIYRQATGKSRGCNCGSCQHGCPRTGESQCHCHEH
ncbi:MAG: FeoB-associated Cys-rich membrane protein [Bacteroidaceae bacterium]|nr:FeoB-associated Cys-rich membrane protein [Bacteroidaceae bacterium]